MTDGLEALPGGELARKGLADLAKGRATRESLWLSIAAGALTELGLPITSPFPDAELRLYALLQADERDPYGAYNALVRRLVSFRRALEAERGREARRASGPTPRAS